MSIGTSIFLIAVGAILKYAITAIGLVMSLIYMLAVSRREPTRRVDTYGDRY